MNIYSDTLPAQWQVILRDGSVLGIWAGAYGEVDGNYVFSILAEATNEEQADPDLMITSRFPRWPERIVFVVARIPIALVANIYTRSWDTRVTPEDLVPTEWAPRPTGEDEG